MTFPPLLPMLCWQHTSELNAPHCAPESFRYGHRGLQVSDSESLEFSSALSWALPEVSRQRSGQSSGFLPPALLSTGLPAITTTAEGFAAGTANPILGAQQTSTFHLGYQSGAVGHPRKRSSCVFLQSRQKEDALLLTAERKGCEFCLDKIHIRLLLSH